MVECKYTSCDSVSERSQDNKEETIFWGEKERKNFGNQYSRDRKPKQQGLGELER